MNSPRLLRIHARDNVYILTASAKAGALLVGETGAHRLAEDLGLGHKIAAGPIAAGEKIRKYGMPIGSALRDIAEGEHVHLHNMKSDYLPTYTHEAGRHFDDHETPPGEA